jgi:hypothetical protein
LRIRATQLNRDIGIARELAKEKTSTDFPEALDLFEKFKPEYEKIIQEHVEIMKALDELEKAAKKTKNKGGN